MYRNTIIDYYVVNYHKFDILIQIYLSLLTTSWRLLLLQVERLWMRWTSVDEHSIRHVHQHNQALRWTSVDEVNVCGWAQYPTCTSTQPSDKMNVCGWGKRLWMSTVSDMYINTTKRWVFNLKRKSITFRLQINIISWHIAKYINSTIIIIQII